MARTPVSDARRRGGQARDAGRPVPGRRRRTGAPVGVAVLVGLVPLIALGGVAGAAGAAGGAGVAASVVGGGGSGAGSAAVAPGGSPVMSGSSGGNGSGAAGGGGGGGDSGQQAGALQEVGQSPWVSPGSDFEIDLTARTQGRRDGPFSVQVTLFDCLTSRSEFAATLRAVPQSGGETTAPVLLPTLPASGDGVALRVGIETGFSNLSSPPTPATPAASLDLDGECSSPARPAGVYPLEVTLLDNDGDVVGRVDTHLVYTGSGTGPRLRFALVIPVGEAAQPGVGTPRLGRGALARITGLTSSLAHDPTVPVTLWPQGQTLEALAKAPTSAGVLQALTLDSLSASSVDEMLDGPYVFVDPSALTASDLGGDVGTQLDRGAAALAGAHATVTPGTFVVQRPLSGAGLGALRHAGVGTVVLPAGDLAVAYGDGTTETQTFELSGTKVDAVANDAELLADASGDSVLAAENVIADLSIVYFEKPYASFRRGLVLALPPGTDQSGAFLATLLDGLAGDPLVEPVTVSTLFAQVARGSGTNGNGWPATRSLAATSTGPLAGAVALSTARRRLGALTSAFGADALTRSLSDALLGTESALLAPSGRRQLLGRFADALERRAHEVTLLADRTIRLTAETAQIPITIRSSAARPVHVAVELESDKLVVLSPNPKHITLDGPTTAVELDVKARTIGVFRVVVTVTSPGGGLVLSSGSFTVQSTSFSEVGIALSVGAVLILVVWWGRTWRKRRRTAGGAHRRGRVVEAPVADTPALVSQGAGSSSGDEHS